MSDAELARYYDSKKNVDLYNTEGHVPIPPGTTWVEVPNDRLKEVKRVLAKTRKLAKKSAA